MMKTCCYFERKSAAGCDTPWVSFALPLEKVVQKLWMSAMQN